MTTSPAPESEQFLDAQYVFLPKFWRHLRHFLPLFALCWVLSLFWIVTTAQSSYSDGASLLGLLVGTTAATTDNQRLGWVFVFAELLASVALLAWTVRGLSVAQAALDAARPLQPAAPDGAARCRVCRAALATSGAVRRCGGCGADHLFVSGALAVEPSAKPRRQCLRAGLRSASRRIVWWLALLPVAFAVALALGGIVAPSVRPTPWLYVIPAAWGAHVFVRFSRAWRELSSVEHAVFAKPVSAPKVASTQLTAAPAPSAGPTDIASATCTSCGGNVPIQLARKLVCPFCHAEDPVPPTLLALLTSVRARIANRAREQQQFADEQQLFTQASLDYIAQYAPLYIVLWAVVAAMMYLSTIRQPGISFTDFALVRSAVTTDDARMAWFYFYSGVWALALTAALPALGLARMRRVALNARAVAPAAPGAPPRCRCCLAPLAAQGTTRRCSYCGADHLVIDDQYRAHEASLDEAIAAATREGDGSLRKALQRNLGYVSASLVLIILAFLGCFAPAAVIAQLLDPSAWLLLPPSMAVAAAITAYWQTGTRLRALSRKASNNK